MGQGHTVAGGVYRHGPGGHRGVVHKAGHHHEDDQVLRHGVKEAHQCHGHQHPAHGAQDTVADLHAALLGVGHEHEEGGHGVPVGVLQPGGPHKAKAQAQHHRQPQGKPGGELVQAEEIAQTSQLVLVVGQLPLPLGLGGAGVLQGPEGHGKQP